MKKSFFLSKQQLKKLITQHGDYENLVATLVFNFHVLNSHYNLETRVFCKYTTTAYARKFLFNYQRCRHTNHRSKPHYRRPHSVPMFSTWLLVGIAYSDLVGRVRNAAWGIVGSIAGVRCGKLWSAGSWVVARPSGLMRTGLNPVPCAQSALTRGDQLMTIVHLTPRDLSRSRCVRREDTYERTNAGGPPVPSVRA